MASAKPSLIEQYNLNETDQLRLKDLLTQAGDIDLDVARHLELADVASQAKLGLDASSESNGVMLRHLLQQEQAARMDAARAFARFDAVFSKAGDGHIATAFHDTRQRLDKLAPGDSESALELAAVYASLGATPPAKLQGILAPAPHAAPPLPSAPEIPHFENEVEGTGLAFSTSPKVIPDDVLSHATRRGNRYLDARDATRTLFVDYGSKLQTPAAFDGHAVRSMVAVAEARGWHAVKVSGSEDFRRAVYMESVSRGLEVVGYKPTEAEKASAEKAAAKNGKANRIEENAMAKAYRTSQTPAERKEAARQYPNLKNAYAMEAALAKFAEQRLQPSARDAFLKRTRQNIGNDLAAGVAFSDVLLRQAQHGRPARTREQEAEQSH